MVMEAPRIEREMVKPLLDTRFIKVFDLQYAPGKHYYDASRRKEEDLVALKSGEEFRAMSADAATCFVIVEKRFRFTLSPSQKCTRRSRAMCTGSGCHI